MDVLNNFTQRRRDAESTNTNPICFLCVSASLREHSCLLTLLLLRRRHFKALGFGLFADHAFEGVVEGFFADGFG